MNEERDDERGGGMYHSSSEYIWPTLYNSGEERAVPPMIDMYTNNTAKRVCLYI